jgi:rhodanese-related sulfurtransferase
MGLLGGTSVPISMLFYPLIPLLYFSEGEYIAAKEECTMRFRRNRTPVIAVLVLLFVLASAATLMAKARNINTQESYELIEERDGDSDFVILDVRTPEEFAEGHIESAVNIDFYADAFPDELDGLDRDKTYLIYCRSGSRSGSTFKMMKQLGFKNVFNMKGGIESWRVEYPVVR